MSTLASKQTLQELAKRYAFTPNDREGQHFLISLEVLEQMVAAARLSPSDTVLEIGPGFGTLTVELARRVKQVVAVEKDRRFLVPLQKLASLHPTLKIIQGDALALQKQQALDVTDGQYALVSNLPYGITSRVLRIFLDQPPRPTSLTLLIQKEVAERVTALPGSMSLLSIAVQFYADATLVAIVPPEAFWPAPAVVSAIIRVNRKPPEVIEEQCRQYQLTERDFFRIVTIGFAARRKQLHNNLASGLRLGASETKDMLESVGLDPSLRPQELGVEQWLEIAGKAKELMKFSHLK